MTHLLSATDSSKYCWMAVDTSMRYALLARYPRPIAARPPPSLSLPCTNTTKSSTLSKDRLFCLANSAFATNPAPSMDSSLEISLARSPL